MGVAGALGYAAAGGLKPSAQPDYKKTATAEKAPPLGSPESTTTIDGRYLPSPPAKFGGEINLNANQSKPY